MEKKKILVVDDVPANIHLLSTILKDDFLVIAAKSGEKALELAQKEHKPDLILLDILMPDMDGYEVCKALKSNDSTSHIPVIFISSMNDIQEQEKALQVGGADFIFKPVSKEILLQKIDLHLRISITKEIKMDRKRKILIVDDAPENIKIVMEILKKDYNVIAATTGEKALEIVKDHHDIDLILLDIIMPEMDGFEVCQKIKKDPLCAGIPIIFLTILENEEDIVKAFEYGAVDYVTKPFELSVLKARVDAHVRLRVQENELIANLKQKDQILIKQSKLATLGEMFESITHQWKQPLSIISMSNANIRIEKQMNTLSDQTLFEMLDKIDHTIGHMLDTVDVFRGFLSNDQYKEYFNLQEMIETTILLLESKFSNKMISIEKNIQFTEIFTLKNDLIQVLMNILGNAIHALEKKEEEKKIKIDGKVEGEMVTILVCDNGGGIPQEHMDKIFHKYFTTKEDKKGSGIGLYISKKIVQENLGGNLEAYNTQDGACFKITLTL